MYKTDQELIFEFYLNSVRHLLFQSKMLAELAPLINDADFWEAQNIDADPKKIYDLLLANDGLALLYYYIIYYDPETVRKVIQNGKPIIYVRDVTYGQTAEDVTQKVAAVYGAEGDYIPSGFGTPSGKDNDIDLFPDGPHEEEDEDNDDLLGAR